MCFRREISLFASFKKLLVIGNSVPLNTGINLCLFLGGGKNGVFFYEPAVFWERESEISCHCRERQRSLWQQAIARRLKKPTNLHHATILFTLLERD